MQDNGDEFHDKDPPSLRIHVDRTMVYLLRVLEESGVTRRRALRAFGCLLYMRLMSARRECDGGNRRRETVCVVAPRVVVVMVVVVVMMMMIMRGIQNGAVMRGRERS